MKREELQSTTKKHEGEEREDEELSTDNTRKTDGASAVGKLKQPTSNANDGLGLQRGDLKSAVSDQTLNQNANWVQRASWKSLVGADGRANFSLKSSMKGYEREPEEGSQKQKSSQANNGGATEPELDTLQTTQKGSLKDLETHAQNKKASSPASRTLARNKRPRSSKFVEGVEGVVVVAETNVPIVKKKKRPDGSSFMRSATAEEEWRASRSELRMDSKAKHKAAVRTMKKLWGPGIGSKKEETSMPA